MLQVSEEAGAPGGNTSKERDNLAKNPTQAHRAPHF